MNRNKMGIITIIMIAFLGGICFGLNINKTSQQEETKTPVTKVVNKCQKETKTISDIKREENIVFLGDSITDYYPIDDIFNDLPIVNSGVAGYKTDDILSRMDNMVYRYNPTSVFLLIGTNDLNDKSKEDMVKTVEENITKIVENIKEHRKNTKIYIESIYPVNKSVHDWVVENRTNEDIRKVNEYIKKYCEENNYTYIDMYNILKDEDGNFDKKYTTDGLHANALGYARISQVLSRYLYDLKS